MPLEIISGEEAFSGLAGNRVWPKRKDAARLVPYPVVDHHPKFSIGRTSRIFAIGSCFASNIERNLVALGMPPLSCRDGSVSPTARIRYTTRSILQDIRKIAHPERWMDTVYAVPEGMRWQDCNELSGKPPLSESEMMEFCRRYYTNLSLIRDCDVMIITLGLVECWYDKERRVYLNFAPDRDVRAVYPERFEVHILSYDDVYSDLCSIVDEVNAISQCNILVTVSPVPLLCTFRDQDCLQANMYSKSVQRTAVERLCLDYDNVSYFPSFEIVSLSDNSIKYSEKRDLRHIRDDMVGHIMRHVMSSYVDKNLLWEEPKKLKDINASGRYNEVISYVDNVCSMTNTELTNIPLGILSSLAIAYKYNHQNDMYIKTLRAMMVIKPSNHLEDKIFIYELRDHVLSMMKGKNYSEICKSMQTVPERIECDALPVSVRYAHCLSLCMLSDFSLAKNIAESILQKYPGYEKINNLIKHFNLMDL